MKRIVYVLIALFTLIGSQASANQSEGGECSCDESLLVLGPVTLVQTSINCSTYDIQVPPVTGCLDVELSHSYFFQILNPSGFPIHSESSASPTIQYDFGFDTPGQYWIVVTYSMTDNSGCVHTLPPSVVPFNWLGCGNCSCDPSNLVLGQITMEQSTSDCSSYIINVPPVLGCANVLVSQVYNFRIYNASGALVFDVDEPLDGTLFDFIYQPVGIYTIIATYTMTDDSGCTHTIPSVSTTFDWTGCDNCSCDEDELELGPITFIQSTSDCSSYVLNVPPVLGCSAVTESRNYNFKVYNSSGFLVYNVDESLDGTLFDFGSYPPGMFTIVVTFSMKDDSGCEHELPPVTANFDWTGCGCNTIAPPSILECNEITNPNNGALMLSWNAVSGAASYEVEIYYNDPTCCPGQIGNPNKDYFVVNRTSHNMLPSGCYSWRVRSKCTDGTLSAWSSSVCSCETGNLGSPKSAIQSDEERITDESLKLTAVPNPATNHVDITLSGVLVDANLSQTKVIIYDMAGKAVYQSEIALDETKRVDVNSFNSGLYIIKIVDNNSLLSTEKLIVE